MGVLIEEILELSVPERLRIIGEVWDSLAESANSAPLSQAERDELDRRLADYYENPAEGIEWSELKEKLLKLR